MATQYDFSKLSAEQQQEKNILLLEQLDKLCTDPKAKIGIAAAIKTLQDQRLPTPQEIYDFWKEALILLFQIDNNTAHITATQIADLYKKDLNELQGR